MKRTCPPHTSGVETRSHNATPSPKGTLVTDKRKLWSLFSLLRDFAEGELELVANAKSRIWLGLCAILPPRTLPLMVRQT